VFSVENLVQLNYDQFKEMLPYLFAKLHLLISKFFNCPKLMLCIIVTSWWFRLYHHNLEWV